MVDEKSKLETVKAGNVPQLLFKAARLLNERALADAREAWGMPGLRPSHTSVFPHLELDGIRLTELAQRMGISKQAAGQLVDELVDMGVLTRAPDPDDGRAKLIVLPKGARSLIEGMGVLQKMEKSLRRELGSKHVDALHSSLTALLAYLEGSR